MGGLTGLSKSNDKQLMKLYVFFGSQNVVVECVCSSLPLFVYIVLMLCYKSVTALLFQIVVT